MIGLVGLMSVPAFAQSSAKVVKVKPEQSVYKVKQGSAFQVAVVIDIDGGYHINSNKPAEDFLIPTSLKIQALPGLRANTVRYPKAKVQKFPFSETPMSVYEGRAVLRFTARALPSLSPGSHTIKGKLTVQACNDQACLRPQTVDVEIPLEVS
ncbi:MAG TPA: protein-disulfide reductase DsbD N-terminal domain-containing protein [Blastocatellia bacterium]|nr:protein-disulfide reductase DsbD N-terminal domain-containing protein [Blastocatellia bacterium]